MPPKPRRAAKPAATHSLTCVITSEGAGFVSLCPELDVASQGDTVPRARANLVEAVEAFFECASPRELKRRWLTGAAREFCGLFASRKARATFWP